MLEERAVFLTESIGASTGTRDRGVGGLSCVGTDETKWFAAKWTGGGKRVEGKGYQEGRKNG